MLDLLTFSRMSSAMAVSNAFSRAMKSHTSVAAGTSKELLSFSDHEVHDVHAFLRCDTRASLHDCCSASVMLDSRAMQLRLDPETSLLSLLHRMPNQVSTQHYLRVNRRLFSVFKSSAGGSRSVVELDLQNVRDVVGR